MASLLQPPRTCQRVDTAQRAALLIGDREYFEALRASILAARHSLLILGWHVDAGVLLGTDSALQDGLPVRLRELLVAALERRPSLRVFISAWDFSVAHTRLREQLAPSGFEQAHPRLFYRVDAQHAASASHHETLVVIDDWLAFVGSADLSTRSWPARESAPRHADRARSEGAHTSQLCLQGPAARALSFLARGRAVPAGEVLALAPESGDALWPPGLASELSEIPAVIVRTRGAADAGQEAVREALEMTLAAIEAAERYLYIETEYLSSRELVEALCARLLETAGPEVVLLLPGDEDGWLGQQGMMSLRRDAVRLLHAHDTSGRLRVYQPTTAARRLEQSSRLIIVDGRLLKVGSSDLTNRSMSLDTECDVWLEAGDHGAAVEHMLHRLLSAHLAVDSQQLATTLAESGSLIATIESLRGRHNTLEPVLYTNEAEGHPSASALALELEQPSAAEAFVRYFAPSLPARRQHRTAVAISALAAGLAALVLLLVLVSNPQSAIRTTLAALIERVRDPQFGLLYVLLAYALGTLVCAPITALFAATALVLSPLRGFVYALLGGLFGATLSYWLGRTLGSGPLRRVRGARLAQLRHEVQTRSFRSVLIARFLPLGNFTLINLFLGSLKVPYLAFISATGLGMLPGLLGLTLLSEQLQEAFQKPSLTSIGRLLLIGAALLFVMIAFWRRREQRARHEATQQQAATTKAQTTTTEGGLTP